MEFCNLHNICESKDHHVNGMKLWSEKWSLMISLVCEYWKTDLTAVDSIISRSRGCGDEVIETWEKLLNHSCGNWEVVSYFSIGWW